MHPNRPNRIVLDPDILLDQRRVAKLLGITTKFLEARRWRGGGPPFIHVGRLVRYRYADVQGWIEANKASSTSDRTRRAKRVSTSDRTRRGSAA